MNNEIFKQLLQIGEESNENDYYSLVIGQGSIPELKNMIYNILKCDLFNQDLLTFKIFKRKLENGYFEINDEEYNCVEIYYDEKCITGYFIGQLEFKDISGFEEGYDGGVFKLNYVGIGRDLLDCDFQEVFNKSYPDLDFNSYNNDENDEVDEDELIEEWLNLKRKRLENSNYCIFCSSVF